jgi:xylan 1,4-beta-xylosidase
MRKIEIDLRKTDGQNSRSYNFCVGGGRAYETLVAENQRHLAMAHDACGFRYLRFHGLLHDDMAVYHEDEHGTPYYNWQYIDLLFDAMLRIGVKPFVELSFMPGDLASGKSTVFFWRGNVTMPRDLTRWGGLVEALVRHVTARYGEPEVESWLFEVWNEPNLKCFFDSESPFEDYMKLYAESSRAVKRVNPKYRVGGPATAACAWIAEFITACADRKLPVDFISTHSYGVEGCVDENGTSREKMIPDRNSVSGDMVRVREIIRSSVMPELPLYFTEWSSSYSPRDNAHDSYHEAAFVLTRVKQAFRSVDAMSYWTFSDIFEECGPGPKPFHGGFGLLNETGLKKPAFFAFHYLNQLGDTLLTCSDQDSLCTKSKTGVQVLFWDYTMPKQTTSNQEYFQNDLPAAPAPEAEIRISGMEPGEYRLELFSTGYRRNDVYTFYRELDTSDGLSREQHDYLDRVCSDAPLKTELIRVGEDGVFTFPREMRQNDVYLLTLERN